ncbi:MAG: hypothetical protein IJA36_02440 [Lachnospiraceae bacterium]|nr:hypothetical protein [Lachnospiraceae bacterium]
MKKKSIIALLIALSCFTTACSTNADNQKTDNTANPTTEASEANRANTEPTSLPTNTPEPTQFIPQEPEISMDTLSDTVSGTDGVEAYTYLYTYPNITIPGNEAATKLITTDQELKKQTFSDTVKNNIAGAKEYYESVIASNYIYEFYGAGYDKVEYELSYSTKERISFKITNSAYSIGGYHASSQINGVTYDAITGEILDIDELFEEEENAVDTMKDMVLNQCLKEGYITSDTEGTDEIITTIVEENNWFLAEDGIHFIANEYVLTGAGEYKEFVFSYGELPQLKQTDITENNAKKDATEENGQETEMEESSLTGEELTWKDILENEQEGKAEVKEALIKQINMTKLEENSKQELLNDIDNIIKNENWHFSKVGIHVITGKSNSPVDINYEFILPYNEITQLKEKYQPEAKVWHVTNGGSNTLDLDGDGSEDVISYSVDEETKEINLTIKETNFGSQLFELGVDMAETPINFCYLVDLNESDSYIEIVVADYGLGESYSTNFLRYDKGELIYLGRIYDDFEATTCKLLGDGFIVGREECNIFQSGRLEHEYVLLDNRIASIVEEWYVMDIREYFDGEEQICKILKDVTVYTQDSTASATKVLTPSNGPVTFPVTDDKEWVQLCTADGTIYYVHVIEGLTIENGIEEEYSYDVFDNLLIGG